MKMPQEWLGQSAQDRMADLAASAYAPVGLWACMSSLTGGVEPIATMVQRQVQEGSTEWRALWLTENLIAHGSVVKGKEGWSAYSEGSGDDRADETSGWIRSIREVAKIELMGAACRRICLVGESDRSWTWSSSARVRVDDA